MFWSVGDLGPLVSSSMVMWAISIISTVHAHISYETGEHTLLTLMVMLFAAAAPSTIPHIPHVCGAFGIIDLIKIFCLCLLEGD